MDLDRFYVYLHRKASDGLPFYVGKGTGDRAWQDGNRRSAWWRRTVDKYGLKVEILANSLDEELAFLVECEAIDRMRRIGAKLVNMTTGGEGFVLTDQGAKERHRIGSIKAWADPDRRSSHAAKVSAALSGRPKTEEHRSRLSAAHTGKTLSAEHRAMIGIAHRGRTLTHEWRQALRDAHARPEVKAKTLARKRRSGRQVMCVETGQVFDYATDAAAWLISTGVKARREGIKDAAIGNQKTAYGYTWRYPESLT